MNEKNQESLEIQDEQIQFNLDEKSEEKVSNNETEIFVNLDKSEEEVNETTEEVYEGLPSENLTTTILENTDEITEIPLEEVDEKSITESYDTLEELTEEEITEEEIIGESVNGKIQGCTRLNIRREPNSDAEIICVIDEATELSIDKTNSTEDFYKVEINNVCGYCIKKFIKIV